MIRTFVSFPITDIKDCKQHLLNWANQFDVCCFLDNHNYSFSYNSYQCILAAGVSSHITASSGDAFHQLTQYCSIGKDWIFGHLSYDLKNELEQLESSHPDGISFPDLFFFVPEYVILLNDKEMSIGSLNNNSSPQTVCNEIFDMVIADPAVRPPVDIKSRFTKAEYITAVQKLQEHIQKGDCYEINFCQEFFSNNILLNPLQLYFALSDISPNPFAAFYKIDKKFLCCASPERYLKKEGDKIISQPIKGTSPRDLENAEKDSLNKKDLYASGKDRTENVMIVDLVRNDLSKICEEGTVKVEELYGIYSFPQVHQMISTVTGTFRKELHLVEALKASFPMGSMTGAPKKRVMELIEQYEITKRGLFSGSVGYITPEGNFDFNVVIRSILYNQEQQYLSYLVGSAITFNSDPAQEYEECLLKAAAIQAVLTQSETPVILQL